MTATKRTWEDRATTGITLVLGAAAFAGSYSHIRDVAAANGQPGWISYAIAGSVDFMAVGSGLEIRRRRRFDHPARWPRFTLLLSVAMTLAANLATAGPGPWGALMAVWPAVAFLSVAGLLETRTKVTAPAPALPVRIVEDEAATVPPPVPTIEDQGTAVPADEDQKKTAVDDLLLLGHAIAEQLARDGRNLTRQSLIDEVRSRGRGISTGRATQLLRQLREPAA